MNNNKKKKERQKERKKRIKLPLLDSGCRVLSWRSMHCATPCVHKVVGGMGTPCCLRAHSCKTMRAVLLLPQICGEVVVVVPGKASCKMGHMHGDVRDVYS